MTLGLLLPASAQAQMQRSEKRGMCDNGEFYSEHAIAELAPGVTWTYNWAPTPGRQPANLGGAGCDVNFSPMCWNGYWNDGMLTQYLNNNPGVRYLLGFNEPNFSSQAKMTPAEAAEKWPQLEAYAEQYNLKLVSPALNFTGERVGGQVLQPAEWFDASIAEYNSQHGTDPRMDYLALHCYMDYPGAVDWYVNQYLYVDNNNSSHPNLKRYFEEHGQTQLLLTEFCSWENNNGNLNADFQVQSMVEKLQVLELSEHVAGYCWFMAHGNNNYGYPYYRIFESNNDDSPLTRLGTIYVYSSAFDSNCYFAAGQRVQAKDYMHMSGGKIDLNTDPDSEAKIEFSAFNASDGNPASARYQVELTDNGVYTLSLRLKLLQGQQAAFSIKSDDNLVAETTLIAATSGWQTHTIQLELPAGRHMLQFTNSSNNVCGFNWFQLDQENASSAPGIKSEAQPASVDYINLQGQRTAEPQPGVGIVVTNMSDGTRQVSKRINK